MSGADDPVELTLALLRRATRDGGFALTADDRVSEMNAARLLQVHVCTLARWRLEGGGPKSYGIGVGRAKISYRLIDVALFIERHREKATATRSNPIKPGPKG